MPDQTPEKAPVPAIALHVNVPIPGTNQHMNMDVNSARKMHETLGAILAQVDAANPTPPTRGPAPKRKRAPRSKTKK